VERKKGSVCNHVNLQGKKGLGDNPEK